MFCLKNVLKEKSIYFYTSAFFHFFSIRQNIFFNLPQMMHFYNSLRLFSFTIFLFLFKISLFESETKLNQKNFSFTVIKNDSKCVCFRFFFCFRFKKLNQQKKFIRSRRATTILFVLIEIFA